CSQEIGVVVWTGRRLRPSLRVRLSHRCRPGRRCRLTGGSGSAGGRWSYSAYGVWPACADRHRPTRTDAGARVTGAGVGVPTTAYAYCLQWLRPPDLHPRPGGWWGHCSGNCVGHGLAQDVQTVRELLVGDRQRRQQLDDLVLGTGGLHQQTGFEGVAHGGLGVVRVLELQPTEQAAALGRETLVRVVGHYGVQRRLHKGSLADGRTLQLVVGPVPANGLRSGDEGGCEPTERAV